MRARTPLVPTMALVSLACGGLFVSAGDRVMLAEALQQMDADQAVPLFVMGTSEMRVVNPLCSECITPYASVGADMRRPIGANALMDTPCMCPSTCATSVLEDVAPLERDEQIARVAEVCDAEGADPIFVDELIALRPYVDVIDYGMVRMLAEPMDGTDEMARMRPILATGMALRGAVPPEPTDELTVTGHGAEPFAALASELTQCGEGLAHRLVVDPEGSVQGVDGPGCRDVLGGLLLPGDGWRVVDVAWSPAGIAGGGDGTEAPEEAPADDGASPGTGPSPAPAPSSGKPGTKLGRPDVEGSLDKNVIAKVIRRHANQIRYCYERQLQKDPTLEGKASVAFVIGAGGKVVSAKMVDSLDPAVDDCIIGRFRRMTFPAPSGGGVVNVTYPFVFSLG